MSGELRTSQFRWTTTANDDFVIGSPDNVAAHSTKFLVFQTTTTPGYATNPHFKCVYTGSSWELAMNVDGITDLVLTDAAYKSQPNTFSNINTFSGSLIANAGLTASNVDITSPSFTVNSGGALYSSGGSGISVEENGLVAGYINIDSTTRDSWNLKVPGGANAGSIIKLLPGTASVSLTMPSTSGTLATADNVVDLTTDQLVAGNKSFSGRTYFSSILNSGYNITDAGDAYLHSLILVEDPGIVNDIGYFTGAFNTGKLLGLGLPLSGTVGSTPNQTLCTNGGTAPWTAKSVLVIDEPSILANVTAPISLRGHDSVNVTGGGSNHETEYEIHYGASGFLYGTTGSPFSSEAHFKMGSFGNVVGHMALKYFAGSSPTEYGSLNFNTTYAQLQIDSAGASAGKLTGTSGKTTLELIGPNSSSIILKDQTTGTRYELYVDSGILHLALA